MASAEQYFVKDESQNFMHVHFPFIIDFGIRNFVFQRIGFNERAQMFGCCHFLDKFLKAGRKFREKVVSGKPFDPVYAAAVKPHCLIWLQSGVGNDKAD